MKKSDLYLLLSSIIFAPQLWPGVALGIGCLYLAASVVATIYERRGSTD